MSDIPIRRPESFPLVVGNPLCVYSRSRYAIISPAWMKKMDHLLLRQWQKLMEIQQIQMDLMEEIARKPTK